MLATFVLHPPANVDVAACFLGRPTGQATADYILDILCRQLAVHAAKPNYQPAMYLRKRIDDFLDLLAHAAHAADQRGHRLLLVVDGLDEDQTDDPGLAVAEWLPDTISLPSNAWLLVTEPPRVQWGLGSAGTPSVRLAIEPY